MGKLYFYIGRGESIVVGRFQFVQRHYRATSDVEERTMESSATFKAGLIVVVPESESAAAPPQAAPVVAPESAGSPSATEVDVAAAALEDATAALDDAAFAGLAASTPPAELELAPTPPPDLSELTKAELMAMAAAKGIKVSVRDSRAELLAAVMGAPPAAAEREP